MIYDISAKFKEVVGVVNDVIVLERESFEVMMTELNDKFVIEKAVKFNLKDYKDGKSVSILKINKEGRSYLVISDMLTY